MSRIKILTGHFGSGKTEIAINLAKRLKFMEKKTCIIDIDIVNPYFCIREIKEQLENEGISIVSANKNFSNAELMIVPPEVVKVFNDKSYEVVIDVGGDESGAIVLGRYNRYLKEEECEVYFVVNKNRPLTSKLSDAVKFIKSIEKRSRLKVTHLISNSNLLSETTINDILEGDEFTFSLSKETGIPYKYTICDKEKVKDFNKKVKGEIFTINLYMKKPWEQV